jgi:hypothetical protein
MTKELGVEMAVIQNKVENIEKEQAKNYLENKQDHDGIRNENRQEHADIIKKLDDFINSADKRYASKTTQKIVYGLVGLILVAAFAAILKLIMVI